MRIYVFGNPLVREDAYALTLMDRLQVLFPQIEFIEGDPNSDFPPAGEKDPVILDAVKGIDRTQLIDFSDLAMVDKSPVSPHDYDLLLHLLLLRKMGRLDSVRIIGIPYGRTGGGIEKEASAIIRGMLSRA